MIHFGNWDDEIHDYLESRDRILTASAEKTSPDFIDVDNETAYFEGRGKKPYVTTMDNCTCGDFVHRRMPCKHIYRLAMQLGLFEHDFQQGRNKNNVIKYISKLTYEAKEILYDLVQNIKKGYRIFPASKYTEELIINGFCYESIQKGRKTNNTAKLSLFPEIEEISYDVAKALRKEIRADEELQMTFDLCSDTDNVTAMSDNASERDETTSSMLGCCSRYRECSKIGKCLHEGEEYYLNCAYRSNLEQGKVFYTDTSSRYNADRFNYISSFYYQELNTQEQEIFLEILSYFCVTKRGTHRCFCLYRDDLFKVIQRCNAFDISPETTLINNLFDSSVMLLKNSQDFYKTHTGKEFPKIDVPPPQTAMTESKRKVYEHRYKLLQTKKNIIATEEIHKELSKRYILLSISDYAFELEEFFRSLKPDVKHLNYKYLVFLNNRRRLDDTTEESSETDDSVTKKFKEALLK